MPYARQLPPLLAALLALAAGCSGAPRPAADAPAFDPKGQSKCAVTKSQARPLIVEWASADRAELEDRAKKGLVAVRYAGCELEILPACRAPGEYRYSAITKKRDRVVMRDADDLYANVPVGAAKLETKLAKAGELAVAMTIVGRLNADRSSVRAEELVGECAQATHVVTALTTGAFEFYAGAEAELGAGVSALGAGAGARTQAKRETLAQDGDQAACDRATEDDKRPPPGCGAFLRLEVVPVTRPAPAVAPVATSRPAQDDGPEAGPIPTPAIAAPSGDRDGDGVPDARDKCPDAPEDKDGFQDDDGCPDPDNDGDGILDVRDRCPNEPEDRDGFQDDDGCPDPDNDRDGIVDARDRCPNDPETFNGFEDEDGCPDRGPAQKGPPKPPVLK